MPRGKNINLFLMDGDASGRIKCTLANWTGVAYKIPRTEIEKCKNREDLKWSGAGRNNSALCAGKRITGVLPAHHDRRIPGFQQ